VIRLGLRLAVAGGRGSVAGLALTAAAVGLGTAVLLFALSFGPALGDRTQRAAWRSPVYQDITSIEPGAAAEARGVLFAAVDDHFGADAIFEARLAGLGAKAPVPPGIPSLPAAGEAYVSPALASLLAVTPADQLGDRFGRVVGTIGDEALRSPDELAAVIGSAPAALRAQGGWLVTAFPGRGRLPDLPPTAALLVALTVAGALAPVGVLVASATRLSAARREQRLAALRLVGATPVQTARLAAVEAFVATAVGAGLGVVFFFLLRPLVALIPLDGATWFPAAIAPPLFQAAVLLAAVPVVGMAAALLSLRRISVSPLGVQRRTAPPAPGLRRLMPLSASIAVLLGSLGAFRSDGADGIGLFVVAVAFAGVIGGIAIAGPLLTAIVGRILRRLPAGGATLLAARRLTDDPRGSFGSIAGVVMAVFVATTFLTFTAVARNQTTHIVPLVRPGTVMAAIPQDGTAVGARLAARLVHVTGVRDVLAIRSANLVIDDAPSDAWVAPCAKILVILELPGTSCGSGAIHPVGSTEIPAGSYTLYGANVDPTAEAAPAAKVRISDADLEPFVLQPGNGGAWLPQVIIDPGAVSKGADAFAVTNIYVATDGTDAAVERVRTAIFAATPTASVPRADQALSTSPVYDEIGRIVVLGLLGTMGLAGLSLAVAVSTAVADRRRQLVFLRSAGMSIGSLRAMILLQAGAPLVAVAAFSAALGVLVTQGIMTVGGIATVAIPGPETLGILGASIAVALAVVALTLPGLDRMTRPETLRVE
jgi:hypothetical protein